MRKTILFLTLFFALFSLYPLTLTASYELSGWFSPSLPLGKLADYGFGAVTIGGTGRMSRGLTVKSSIVPTFFGEFNYTDLGLEKVRTPSAPPHSEMALNVATDFYLMMISTGISLARRSGHLRPYCDFFGGVTYYSTLSGVASLYSSTNPFLHFIESDGTAWHAGFGAGIKILLWRNPSPPEESWLNEFSFNIRLCFIQGGKMRYPNARSIGFRENEVICDFKNVNISFFQTSFGASLGF